MQKSLLNVSYMKIFASWRSWMHLRAIGRQFTQMNAYFLVMNSKRCTPKLRHFCFILFYLVTHNYTAFYTVYWAPNKSIWILMQKFNAVARVVVGIKSRSCKEYSQNQYELLYLWSLTYIRRRANTNPLLADKWPTVDVEMNEQCPDWNQLISVELP